MISRSSLTSFIRLPSLSGSRKGCTTTKAVAAAATAASAVPMKLGSNSFWRSRRSWRRPQISNAIIFLMTSTPMVIQIAEPTRAIFPASVVQSIEM